MVQDTALTVIDTIMTLLLLVKIINLVVNFLIFSDPLLFKYFSLWEEKYKFISMTSKWRQITSLCLPSYA